MLTHTNAGQDRRTIRSRIRPFAAVNHAQLSPDERLFEIQDQWQPTWITFAELYKRTFKNAYNELRRLLPDETHDWYNELLQAAYIRTWERLQDDPQLFAGHPYRFIVVFIAWKARSRCEVEDKRWHESLNELKPNRKGDADEWIEHYFDAYHNNRRPGDPHAGFEYRIDAKLDFEAIKQRTIEHFQEQGKPAAHTQLVWRSFQTRLTTEQLHELGGERSYSYWKRLRQAVTCYLREVALAEWAPQDLSAAMAADPDPYCKLAAQYAEADDNRHLIALYYLLTSVMPRDVYNGPMFPHDSAVFFVHTRRVTRDLMAAYGIYNPAY